jgi:circadian clock protein KaiB
MAVGGPGEAAEVWLLRLYIAGPSTRAFAALANLTDFCELYLRGHYDIETIDLVLHPERARADDILAIPTLERHHPPPVCRVVGDLSEPSQLFACLKPPRLETA